MPATEARRLALQEVNIRFSFQLKYIRSGKQLKITISIDPELTLMSFFPSYTSSEGGSHHDSSHSGEEDIVSHHPIEGKEISPLGISP